MVFRPKFIAVLFLILCWGTLWSQKKVFVLDTAFSPLKFNILRYYYEGKENKKKKPEKPATITLTWDSVKVEGRSVMFEDRPNGYHRSGVVAEMKRNDMWREIFPEDIDAHGYQLWYADSLGTFRYYIVYSPAKDRYWFCFMHTVQHTYFDAERI